MHIHHEKSVSPNVNKIILYLFMGIIFNGEKLNNKV